MRQSRRKNVRLVYIETTGVDDNVCLPGFDESLGVIDCVEVISPRLVSILCLISVVPDNRPSRTLQDPLTRQPGENILLVSQPMTGVYSVLSSLITLLPAYLSGRGGGGGVCAHGGGGGGSRGHTHIY